MLILIDADMYVYHSCAACETEIDWGNDLWTLHVDFNEAKAHFIDKLHHDMEVAFQKLDFAGTFDVIFCFSDKKNFRKKIYPLYKANRTQRKPVAYSAMVEWVKDNYKWEQYEYLEADDVIGIIATTPENKDNCIILSGDKDMKSIPAHFYNFSTGEFTTSHKATANRWFYMQTLVGDTTDNYGGCPKIGKVTAEKILNADCCWENVLKTFQRAGLDYEYALTQARLARILRYEDYDLTTRKIKLWKPTEHD